MKFLVVGAIAASMVAAQDGTCVAGVDPLEVWQQCLGRCHIFNAGDFGACGRQFSQQDAKGPCGDTLATRCYSTFNAGWSDSRANCGNCYYVEMSYPDGTVRSTYLETVDTNGSETKFEMSEVAWVNLCPFACAGTGICAHSAEQCEYGVLPDNGMPAPCAVQSNTVRFKRVDCNGSSITPTTTPTTAPTPTSSTASSTTSSTASSTTSSTASSTTSSTASSTTSSTASSTTSSTTSSATSSTSSTTTPTTTTTTTTTTTSSNPGGNGDPISQCKGLVGYPGIADWDANCKSMCDYYGAPPQNPFCSYTTGAELAACVKKFVSYCVLSS